MTQRTCNAHSVMSFQAFRDEEPPAYEPVQRGHGQRYSDYDTLGSPGMLFLSCLSGIKIIFFVFISLLEFL